MIKQQIPPLQVRRSLADKEMMDAIVQVTGETMSEIVRRLLWNEHKRLVAEGKFTVTPAPELTNI